MSFLADFVGSAAGAGAGILASQMDAEQKLDSAKSLGDYSAQLELQRMQTIQDMTQSKNASDAAQIKSAVDSSRAGRVQQMAQTNSDDSQSSALQSSPHAMGPVDPSDPANPARTVISLDDAKQIMTDPSQMQKYGIVNASRAQTLGDQADAAIALGRNDLAKDFQAQQQIEISNSNAARSAASQAQLADIASRRADTADRAADNTAQRDANTAKYQDGMLANTRARGAGGGSGGDDTAAILTAKAIQADELTFGRKISLSDAIALTHKAGDVGNTFAMNYAKMYQENGLIGADAKDPTQPGKGKLFPSVDAALAAGFKAYVNPRSNSSSAIPPPAAAPSGLPAGAVQIGTSNNKPVYQMPDGSKFIAN